MYVSLIETKTVHSSAFLLFNIGIVHHFWYGQPLGWIRWRSGICGLQTRVCVHQPPRSKDCRMLGGGLGTRLRTHFIQCGRLRRHETPIWQVERSYAGLMRSVSYFMRLVIYFMRPVSLWSWSANIVADSHHWVWQAGRPSVGSIMIVHPKSSFNIV